MMYYFIGIKGTGMASLATMLYDLGYEVCGSDQEKHFFTEDELVKRGIRIYPFDPDNIKPEYTVIIGNAFLEDFPEVIAERIRSITSPNRSMSVTGFPFSGSRTWIWTIAAPALAASTACCAISAGL